MARRSPWKQLLRLAIIIVATLVGACAVGVGCLIWSLSDVHSTGRFASIRAIAGQSAAHFPTVIPPEAKRVKMVYTPGFLQGESQFQLRFEVSPGEAQSLAASFPKTNEVDSKSPGCIGEVSLKVNGDGPTLLMDLKETHRIFQFFDNKNYNHCRVGGVAINTVTGEVIYFAVGC